VNWGQAASLRQRGKPFKLGKRGLKKVEKKNCKGK
jgi:hypothetical protein